jgi:hypothetical protein
MKPGPIPGFGRFEFSYVYKFPKLHLQSVVFVREKDPAIVAPKQFN